MGAMLISSAAQKLYRDLVSLIEEGRGAETVETVARHYTGGLEPDELFGILARIGSLSFSYECAARRRPQGLIAVAAAHTVSRRLSPREAATALVAAAVLLAQEAVELAHSSPAHFQPVAVKNREELRELLLSSILAGEVLAADGALDALLKLPEGRNTAVDALLQAAARDYSLSGHKLLLGTHLLTIAEKLKWEVAYGVLRPLVHYLGGGFDAAQVEELRRWVDEADVEPRTLREGKRTLTLAEATALADSILNGDLHRALNHALRNNTSAESLCGALSIAAHEWLAQGVGSLEDGVSRVAFVSAVREASRRMEEGSLWPFMCAASLLREDWSGSEVRPFELSIEIVEVKEFCAWAAPQDALNGALYAQLLAEAFLREDLAMAAELKPFLYRAVIAARGRWRDSTEVRGRFEALSG